ncbi:MAG: hypothetical protein OXP09_06530, partial [Gammaproteobacteria bacterium]|nr:hypothetical protein [Gammaproteobacteria bacterium]
PYARSLDELNAPKGKRRMRTLSRDSALFLARPRSGPQTENTVDVRQTLKNRQTDSLLCMRVSGVTRSLELEKAHRSGGSPDVQQY